MMANQMGAVDELPSVDNVQLLAWRPLQRAEVRVIPDRVDVACENWQLSCRRTSTRILLRVTEVELIEQRMTRSVKRSTEEREQHFSVIRQSESNEEFGAAMSTSVSATVPATSTFDERRSGSSERSCAYCTADDVDTDRQLLNSMEADVPLVSSLSDPGSSAEDRILNIGVVGEAEHAFLRLQMVEERLLEGLHRTTVTNEGISYACADVDAASAVSAVADVVKEHEHAGLKYDEQPCMTVTDEVKSNAFADVDTTSAFTSAADFVKERADLEYDEQRRMKVTDNVKSNAFADVDMTSIFSGVADVVKEHADLEYDKQSRMKVTDEVKSNTFADVETANAVSAVADVVEELADLEYDPTGVVIARDNEKRMTEGVCGSVVGGDMKVDTLSSSCDVSQSDVSLLVTESGDRLLTSISSLDITGAGDYLSDHLTDDRTSLNAALSLHHASSVAIDRTGDGVDASVVCDVTHQKEHRSVTEDKSKIHFKDQHVQVCQLGGNDSVRQVEGREEENSSGAVEASITAISKDIAVNPCVEALDYSVGQVSLEISQPSYGTRLDNVSSDNSSQLKVDLVETFTPATASNSNLDSLSRSGLMTTNRHEYRKDEENCAFSTFNMVPDVKCDGAGEQWETMRRLYDPRIDLEMRDRGSSRSPSDWSTTSEIGSAMDGKVAEVTDFDDRSSVASHDEQTGHKMLDDVTGDGVERGTSGADVTGEDVERGTSSDDVIVGDDVERSTSSAYDQKPVDKKDVGVHLKKSPELDLKASGSDGKPKDDIRLDNITSPKRSIFYSSFDIDIDEPSTSGTAAEEDQPADSVLSDKMNYNQNTVEEHQTADRLLLNETTSNRDDIEMYQTEDGHLSSDKISLLLNSPKVCHLLYVFIFASI